MMAERAQRDTEERAFTGSGFADPPRGCKGVCLLRLRKARFSGGYGAEEGRDAEWPSVRKGKGKRRSEKGLRGRRGGSGLYFRIVTRSDALELRRIRQIAAVIRPSKGSVGGIPFA
ncbi:hypothetical protein B5F40_11775 [Gordonibacter sp. An230]|nr:hypothetical protein B5F40_11775 [Gordonibacter sp. An230]